MPSKTRLHGHVRSMRSMRLVVLGASTLAAATLMVPSQGASAASGVVGPIDKQTYEDPDTMTWDDYKPVPGTNWNAPGLKGTVQQYKGALVLLDYPDQKFIVTQPPKSTVFGNPQESAANIPQSQVAQFYHDFLNKPQELNHYQTINSYWLEDSGGRFGVDLTAFGPYTLASESYTYGNN